MAEGKVLILDGGIVHLYTDAEQSQPRWDGQHWCTLNRVERAP